MKNLLPKLLFMFALMSMAFAYGFLSSWAQIFPYQLLRDSHIAVKALMELYEAKDTTFENLEFWDETGLTEPVYKALSPEAGNEDLFILGHDLANIDPDAGPTLAWIADRQGNIKHSWKHPGEIWTSENRDAVEGTWRSYPISAHLYPNGDILVAYQGTNIFPIGMGLAKFDKDSNLLWKNDDFYHHWFSVGPDGNIYILDTLIGESPMVFPDKEKKILCSDDRFPYDSLAVLDPDGKEIREIDLLDAFINSDMTGVINATTSYSTVVNSCDPLHTNDARILTEDMAKEFPMFSAGDILLSFRSLNGFAVLDMETEQFKWFYAGALQQQHSPRFLKGNRIVGFDNYGGLKSQGTTRVVSVDVASGASEVLFPREGVEHPDRAFFSDTTGHIEIHSEQERMLVSFSKKGIVWEIDIESGEVLWELVNTHPIDGKPGRVSVFFTQYLDESISFPMNGGKH